MTRFVSLLFCAIGALAQTAPEGPAPTIRDMRYSEHPKQAIDFYQITKDTTPVNLMVDLADAVHTSQPVPPAG